MQAVTKRYLARLSLVTDCTAARCESVPCTLVALQKGIWSVIGRHTAWQPALSLPLSEGWRVLRPQINVVVSCQRC